MHRDDVRLLDDALRGKREATRTLVDRLTPVVQCRVARALLRRGGVKGRDVRQEVEDLTQEVFEALFAQDGKALRGWDPEKGLGIESFAGLVAERLVLSILRSRRRSPFTEDPSETEKLEEGAPPTPGPERSVASRQLGRVLLEGLRRDLSPLGYQVFEMLFCEEREPAQVGEALGMSLDAVYAWRSRIRKAARAVMAEMEAAS